MSTREEHIERINAVADMLGISPEQLLAAAMNAGAVDAVKNLEPEEAETPPPIVYPKVKFPRYVFREYPKLLYKGYIRDIEETVTKLVPRGDGQGVDQRTFIRVIPDQFVQETREVTNKAEETIALAAGWLMTRGEAIEAAQAAKATQRPIVEKPAPPRRGRPPKINVTTVIEDDGEGDDGINPMAEAAA